MALADQKRGPFYYSLFAQWIGYVAAAYTVTVLAVATARASSHRIENYSELEEVVRNEQFKIKCSVAIVPRFDQTTYALQRKGGEFELNIAGSNPQELMVRKQVKNICQHYPENASQSG